jgi:hypothetical protein
LSGFELGNTQRLFSITPQFHILRQQIPSCLQIGDNRLKLGWADDLLMQPLDGDMDQTVCPCFLVMGGKLLELPESLSGFSVLLLVK